MFISRFYPSISENDIEYVRYNNMYFAFLSCFVIECRLCIILLAFLHVMFCSMLIGNEGKFRSFEKKGFGIQEIHCRISNAVHKKGDKRVS